MIRAAALLLFGLVAGCAANDVVALKQGAANRYEFAAPGNYQQVYRDIAQGTRACWSGGYISPYGAARNVDAELLPDLKKGEITIWQSNIAQSYYATALIEPTADGNAHVTVWNYYSTWNDIGPRMQKWASGSVDC